MYEQIFNFYNTFPINILNKQFENYSIINKMYRFHKYPVLISTNNIIQTHAFINQNYYNNVQNKVSGTILVTSGKLGIIPYILAKKDNVDKIILLENTKEQYEIQSQCLDKLTDQERSKINLEIGNIFDIDNLPNINKYKFNYICIDIYNDSLPNDEFNYNDKTFNIYDLKNFNKMKYILTNLLKKYTTYRTEQQLIFSEMWGGIDEWLQVNGYQN